MLCQVAERGNFFTTWITLTVLAVVMTGLMSGLVFYRYYHRPTFAQWKRKSNPKYPKPKLVRREVMQMLKGVVVATFCPALSLHLVSSGWSQAYCGVGDHGWLYLVGSFFGVWLAVDFFEFFYHRLGHTFRVFWKEHKGHHAFFNPSPFAVIADDFIDQLIRSSPLVFVPMIMPMNMDVLFFTFGAMFYAYGTYLHWGYELRWPDAHHRWINTAYQHYLHHAKSTLGEPFHTGFMFKIWDRLFGSVYDRECLCAKCACERGERTEEAFAKIEKPDYRVLLSPRFWWTGKTPAPAGEPAGEAVA